MKITFLLFIALFFASCSSTHKTRHPASSESAIVFNQDLRLGSKTGDSCNNIEFLRAVHDNVDDRDQKCARTALALQGAIHPNTLNPLKLAASGLYFFKAVLAASITFETDIDLSSDSLCIIETSERTNKILKDSSYSILSKTITDSAGKTPQGIMISYIVKKESGPKDSPTFLGIDCMSMNMEVPPSSIVGLAAGKVFSIKYD